MKECGLYSLSLGVLLKVSEQTGVRAVVQENCSDDSTWAGLRRQGMPKAVQPSGQEAMEKEPGRLK